MLAAQGNANEQDVNQLELQFTILRAEVEDEITSGQDIFINVTIPDEEERPKNLIQIDKLEIIYDTGLQRARYSMFEGEYHQTAIESQRIEEIFPSDVPNVISIRLHCNKGWTERLTDGASTHLVGIHLKYIDLTTGKSGLASAAVSVRIVPSFLQIVVGGFVGALIVFVVMLIWKYLGGRAQPKSFISVMLRVLLFGFLGSFVCVVVLAFLNQGAGGILGIEIRVNDFQGGVVLGMLTNILAQRIVIRLGLNSAIESDSGDSSQNSTAIPDPDASSSEDEGLTRPEFENEDAFADEQTAPCAAPEVAPSVEGKIDLNTAKLEELKSLTGIRDVIAQRIIDGRPFQREEEIINLQGFSQGKFDRIKDRIATE